MNTKHIAARLIAVIASFVTDMGSNLALAAESAAAPELDRRAILSMAGDFAVTFDFKETLSLREGYELAAPKVTGGHEVVRVVEDTGRTITLQHLLVVTRDGETNVIKHWRQDWTFEPETILEYADKGRWSERRVPSSSRRGYWSQSVWQTDDSPRYGALGLWRHERGISSWISELTRRPLPRRDATRNPPYGWFEGVNLHIITPKGWAHVQHNTKLGTVGAETVPYAREEVINTYERSAVDGTPAAEQYWAKTASYWKAVKDGWSAASSDTIVLVPEEADRGSTVAARLMDIADEIAAGTRTAEAGATDARLLIEKTDAGPAPAPGQ